LFFIRAEKNTGQNLISVWDHDNHPLKSNQSNILYYSFLIHGLIFLKQRDFDHTYSYLALVLLINHRA